MKTRKPTTKWDPTWTLVTWEVPTDTREALRLARQLQRRLAKSGGLGRRWGSSRRGAALVATQTSQLRQSLGDCPPDGRLQFLPITDAQFGRTVCDWGPRRKAPADAEED